MQEMLEKAKGRASELIASSKEKGRDTLEAASGACEKTVKVAKGVVEGLSQKEKLAIILAIGIIAGAGIKAVAVEYVTIGYGDYKTSPKNAYDMVELQKQVAKNGGGSFAGGATDAAGGSCQ